MSVTAKLEARVADEFGLVVRPERRDDLGAVAEAIARRCGVDIDDLDGHFDRSPQLLQDMVEALTVGETHFFRHPDDFPLMVDVVASALAMAPLEQKVHLWSAGCASGEEPYSIAMAIDAALGPAALARVHILASDVSRSSLARARAGVYSTWSFRGVPPSIIDRYFTATKDGLVLAAGPVRDAVQLDLSGLEQRAQRLPSASMDVVFFRNVAIYWRTDALDRLYAQVARILKPGGVLLLGPADPRPQAHFGVRCGSPFEHATALVASPSSVVGAEAVDALHSNRVERRTPRHAPKTKPRAAGLRRAKVVIPRDRNGVTTPLRSRAMELGDAGDAERAIGMASQLIESEPSSPLGYLLRGQVWLSQDRYEDAVRDLRSAVFLDADGCVARYWYASALQRAGESEKALRQLRELRRRLEQSPPAAFVEDRETRASELLAAAALLEERLR